MHTRLAPRSFVKRLRQLDRALNVHWDAVRHYWAVTRAVPAVVDHGEFAGARLLTVETHPHVVKRWPHAELTESLLTELRQADGQRYGRAKDFLREVVFDPIRAAAATKRRDAQRQMRDGYAMLDDALRRDTGQRVQVGAIRNEKIGNPSKGN